MRSSRMEEEVTKRPKDVAAPIGKEALFSKEHSQIYQEISLKDDLNLFMKHSKDLLFKEVSNSREGRDKNLGRKKTLICCWWCNVSSHLLIDCFEFHLVYCDTKDYAFSKIIN